MPFMAPTRAFVLRPAIFQNSGCLCPTLVVVHIWQSRRHQIQSGSMIWNLLSRGLNQASDSYLLKDSKILGKGILNVDVVALSDGDGLVVKYEAKDVPKGTKMIWGVWWSKQ